MDSSPDAAIFLLTIIDMKYFLVFIFLCFAFVSCSERQTFLVDGMVSSKRQVEELDSSEIFSYEKWLPAEEEFERPMKGGEATIIAVTTKKAGTESQRQRLALLTLILDLVHDGTDLLIVQDGIIVPSSEYGNLREASSNQLSNAFVMPEKDAQSLYGTHAKPITLVINTYHLKIHYKP